MDESGGVGVQNTQASFRRMYEESLPTVYGFVLMRVAGDRSLAEDLTAETYSHAVAEFSAGRGEVVTLSWLRTVARRRVIDHWRRSSVAKRKGFVEFEGVEPDGATAFAERQLIVELLGRLAEPERVALILRHVEGYSVKDVAEVIGRTAKATESLLSRARTAFRSAYAEAENG